MNKFLGTSFVALCLSALAYGSEQNTSRTEFTGDQEKCLHLLQRACPKNLRPALCQLHKLAVEGSNECLARAQLEYEFCLRDLSFESEAVECQDLNPLR